MLDSPGLDRFPFAQVAAWLARGEIVPFVGAGASRVGADGTKLLPDGRGLAQDLIKAMEGACPHGVGDDLAKVAQLYEKTAFDRSALYDHLHATFEREQLRKEPGDVARLLGRIPRQDAPLFIVTTNYDSFIERAFAAEGKPLCVITQNMRDPDGGGSQVSLILPGGAHELVPSAEFQWNESRFPRDCAFLFKMHGSVHKRDPGGPDDVIITEDDYIDFLVNAGKGMSAYFPPPSLTLAYKQRRFLFLGYSLYDWNFRAFLRMLVLRNALGRRDTKRHWAIQLDPHPVEVKLWEHRNVNVYDGDLKDFCARIRSAGAYER
ncbi:SIR2 family NAD-dependent protein deacylase [Nonomuraea gerenzanensis]|uniref:Uncharacterized protein n=1 Tax=Nonomuraea gerenzanensis TaxID=93944 RepID=A0A1M4EEQ4_9ACTN|nr:SIR2 family protein [Nonomuraea gerenzanensis]UBU09052.1 SIR2 family protein [Nonomuraea gerenzanensis]SBO97437.1 hypothetical protein BN4615_P6953 [Nonomuraea gerenzanensis]